MRCARSVLRERLEGRRAEIEAAISTRVTAIADPGAAPDPTYAEGLRQAVVAALDYGIVAVDAGERREPPIPVPLLAQARLAARNRVSLDTILRRYFAGYSLVADFLVAEAEKSGIHGAGLKRVLRTEAANLDRLLAAVSEEYERESENRAGSTEQRRAERIERLLAGEPIDTSDLSYDFDARHVGAVAFGTAGEQTLRQLASNLDSRLLLVRRDEGAVWAWLCARRTIESVEIQQLLNDCAPGELTIALGEPAEGLAGWRLTHRQAVAALPVARRGPDKIIRYADVALLASALKDDLLVASLHSLYLVPLARCQRPLTFPQGRPSNLPTRGHDFSPPVAIGSPHA